MGNFRFYLTLEKLLNIDEIPEKWGLLETNGKKVFFKKEPVFINDSTVQESFLFYSLIRRILNNQNYKEYLF